MRLRIEAAIASSLGDLELLSKIRVFRSGAQQRQRFALVTNQRL